MRMLDVGCGEGRFCRMLAARGARTVGLDPTAQLIATARARDAGGGAYVRGIAERLPFCGDAFDLAVSYITLVDIAGYRDAIAEMARVLRPGGALLVANVNFVSASTVQGWVRDEHGRRLYVPIDRYAGEWSETLEWGDIRIVNWHRPLSAYMQAYLAAGLRLEWFDEPLPRRERLAGLPEHVIEDAFRVPWFTVMRWRKEREPSET
jgi:SAM-dependent methyltransferase